MPTKFSTFITKLSAQRRDLWLGAALFFIALLFRLWVVQHNQLIFYWDQARDAVIAQEMAKSLDLKIQGPSASGTNDTIFHGVLYYYLIAPIYFLSGGNPVAVAMVLGSLGALSAPLMYVLAKSVARSRPLAFTSGLLVALSFDSAQVHTWVSNPAILGPATLLFFYAIWQTFFLKKNNWLLVVALAFGLVCQAVFFAAILFGPVVVIAYLHRAEQAKNYRLFTWQQLVGSLLIYLALIATMIITELMLWRAGILNFASLAQLAGQPTDLARIIQNIYDVIIIKKMALQTFPTKPLLGVASALFCLVIAWRHWPAKTKHFLLLWLTSPLWLYFIQARRSYHTLAGWENVWYLILPFGLWSLWRTRVRYLALVGLVIVFAWSNGHYVRQIDYSTFNELGIQQGADLHSQLALIDDVYQRAAGQPFSIAALTNPFGMNTTWAYLFAWYGQKHYGYLPVFFGPDQTGIFGDHLLAPTDHPLAKHFGIIEPGLPPGFDARWVPEQEIFAGTPAAIIRHDALRLYEFNP